MKSIKEVTFEEATGEQVAAALVKFDAVRVCNSRLFPAQIAGLLTSSCGEFSTKESHFSGSDSYPSKTDYTFYFGDRVLTAREQFDLPNFWDFQWLTPTHKKSEELHGVQRMR